MDVTPSDTTPLAYANRTGRRPGWFVSVAARVVPGVAQVQRQVGPYAQAWHAANLDALTRPGPRWIVLGDSMSQGVGASAFDAGWVNQVHRRLAAAGLDYAIVNLSASGARADDVLAQQVPVWRALPPRRDDDPRPDLVTLLVGSNDMIRRSHRDELPATFARLLDELPAGAVVATLPNPRQVALAVNALIAQARRARGIVAADMRGGSPSSWRGKLAEDHFHPNDAGYADLADVFTRAIRTSRTASASASAANANASNSAEE